MGTLYIDRRDAQLDYQNGQLRVRDADGTPRGFPLAGLERVVICGNTQLQTRLLTHLADQGINVLLIEGRGARRHAHVGGFHNGDARRRLGQYRLCTCPVESLRWSRLLVRTRAVRLLRLYRGALILRPDLRRELIRVQRALVEGIARVRTCTDIGSLRGQEGAIAAAHFSAYTALFSPELQFTHRNRRPPRDPVNAALSLGYTLTHAEAVRTCLLAGLDPMLGTLHEPSHGRESLACDLNELARADVEHLVWRLFADKAVRKESFEHHEGGVTLNKAARQVFYAAFEAAASTHRRTLRSAAAAIARHCNALAREIQP